MGHIVLIGRIVAFISFYSIVAPKISKNFSSLLLLENVGHFKTKFISISDDYSFCRGARRLVSRLVSPINELISIPSCTLLCLPFFSTSFLSYPSVPSVTWHFSTIKTSSILLFAIDLRIKCDNFFFLLEF